MAMDEVRYCNIHTSGSIGVNPIATKLHLNDGNALDFLSRVKERAWSTALWSATAETGTLGDSPRALQGRTR
jgi:hypothetical protein